MTRGRTTRRRIQRTTSFHPLEPRTLLAGQLLADINVATGDSRPEQLTPAGDILFFTAATAEHGRELWRTDGTPAGTFLLKDIRPGPDSSFPGGLTNINGILYFAANDVLWRSDGTPQGTFRVKAVVAWSSFVAVNDTIYFRGSEQQQGFELWKTDGTEAGTTLVKDIRPGAEQGYPEDLVSFKGALYFTSGNYYNDGKSGRATAPMPVPSRSFKARPWSPCASSPGKTRSTPLTEKTAAFGSPTAPRPAPLPSPRLI